MKGALTRFIQEGNFDVVCLQEAVWSEQAPMHLAHFFDTVDKLKEAGGFEYEVRQSNWGVRFLDGSAIMEQGNVILSKIPIVEQEIIWIHGTYSNEMQYGEDWKNQVENQGYGAIRAKLVNGLTVFTHHGYWQPEPIGNETTVECMRKLADAVRKEAGSVIVCGDMNIVAESPAMRELDFLKDLTAENKVTNTLQYLKLNIDVPCDHVLISNDIKCKDFRVEDRIVSDHKAVITEIGL